MVQKDSSPENVCPLYNDYNVPQGSYSHKVLISIGVET